MRAAPLGKITPFLRDLIEARGLALRHEGLRAANQQCMVPYGCDQATANDARGGCAQIRSNTPITCCFLVTLVSAQRAAKN